MIDLMAYSNQMWIYLSSSLVAYGFDEDRFGAFFYDVTKSTIPKYWKTSMEVYKIDLMATSYSNRMWICLSSSLVAYGFGEG